MASLAFRRAGRISPSIFHRWATAAAVPLTESVPELVQEPVSGTRKAPEEVKLTSLRNGITVASLENHSMFSNVSVFVRAGSRYETYSQRGLTHLLRTCAFLATEDRTALRILREIDFLGGTLTATSTREHMVYSSEFLRGNLEPVVDTLGSVISSPKFQLREVTDQIPRMELEIAAAQAQPDIVVLEELHRVAFRNGLCNPLYCPPYNLSALDPPYNHSALDYQDLKSFVEDWFIGRRMAIVGVGVNHDELVKCAKASFSAISEGMRTPDEHSEYVGGTEVLLPSGSPLAHAAIVCKGASLGSPQKDSLAAGVLQHLLGAANYVKWGSNTTSRLGKAAANAVDVPFAVSSLNLNYSDNGLFGMCAISDGTAMGKLLKAMLQEFNEVAKGNISDADLTRSKNQLKTSFLMATESQCDLVEDIGLQASLKGSYSSLDKTIQEVDSVTKDDVVKFAKLVFGTRATFVAHGNLCTTPRLDHLLAEVSLK